MSPPHGRKRGPRNGPAQARAAQRGANYPARLTAEVADLISVYPADRLLAQRGPADQHDRAGATLDPVGIRSLALADQPGKVDPFKARYSASGRFGLRFRPGLGRPYFA